MQIQWVEVEASYMLAKNIAQGINSDWNEPFEQFAEVGGGTRID